MVKKLKVWLNDKLNKCLYCTVVIKFYRIFITELVFTFFVFKYQNHFEFPKDGKRSPRLKILKIPGGRGGGSSKTPWNGKSWGVGGGCKSKSLPWKGMDIFWNHTFQHAMLGVVTNQLINVGICGAVVDFSRDLEIFQFFC